MRTSAARRHANDVVKVAAYQAPLLGAGSMDALDLIRMRVERCEAAGATILCCPEAILGGLADYGDPSQFAIPAGRLEITLAPLTSDTVTTILGFTELAEGGVFYNSAAVFHLGKVIGVYRKMHPALNRSVYAPGRETPVFRVGALTLGIVICNDSNYLEPARSMADLGARALFVPTNNGLPPSRAGAELVAQTRNVDVAKAVQNRMWIIRADVAGRADGLVSYGSSGVIDPDGTVVRTARELSEDLIVAEIGTLPRRRCSS